jgi:VanZ family protein
MNISLRSKAALIILTVYWAVIFTLTHIPIKHFSFLVMKVNISDKIFHFLAYFILIILLWAALRPLKKVNWHESHVWWILLVIVWYGILDEWLQMYAGRGCSVYDFLADISGAITALILLSIFSFWPVMIIITAMTIFAVKNLTVVDLAVLFPRISILFHLFAYAFFSSIWSRYIHQALPQNMSQSKRLILFISVPVTLLLVTESPVAILGKTLQIRDIIISVLSIAIVSLFYMFVLKREESVVR